LAVPRLKERKEITGGASDLLGRKGGKGKEKSDSSNLLLTKGQPVPAKRNGGQTDAPVPLRRHSAEGEGGREKDRTLSIYINESQNEAHFSRDEQRCHCGGKKKKGKREKRTRILLRITKAYEEGKKKEGRKRGRKLVGNVGRDLSVWES